MTSFEELVKMAEDPMKDYQRRVVQRIGRPDQPGLVVAHQVGTGKTRTSIEAAKRLRLPTTVIPPAALKANYNKEIGRWMGTKPANMDIVSQQLLARNGMEKYDKPGGMLIVDEAHKAREISSQLQQALQESRAKKMLLLTGTPTQNGAHEIAPLVNLAARKKVLPEGKAEFENQYVDKIPVYPNFFQRMMGLKPGFRSEIKNRRELAKVLHKYVDYQPSATAEYPSIKEDTLRVPMGDRQTDLYKTILGKSPAWVRWKVKAGLPPGKGELEALKAFLSGVRQVSNTNSEFVTNRRHVESAKIDRAFRYLQEQIRQNPRYKAVVYSNYLNSGLAPYRQLLQKNNIPFGEFSGDIPSKVRSDLVNQYNANKLKALLISSAGAEGLDLKGTRLVQLLEPHFNEGKEKQIIGRAARYRSHAALPPNEQNVLVQRYLAEPRSGFMSRLFGSDSDRGTDEYIRNIAQQKTLLTDQIMKILSEQRQ